jgi:hypothetical protein
MKIRILAVAALPLGFACSTTSKSSASAPTASATGTTAAPPAPTGAASAAGAPASDLRAHTGDQVISGRVASISGDLVTIDSGVTGKQTLAIATETLVTVDGRAAHVSDLAPGQDVQASFNDVNGKPTAVRIQAGQGVGGPQPTPGSQAGSQDDAGQGGQSPDAAPANPGY